jgi:hypothetical protein
MKLPASFIKNIKSHQTKFDGFFLSRIDAFYITTMPEDLEGGEMLRLSKAET